ncbi:Kinetochore protein Spc24 [Holothuria leucospilota]|uniref:Kinetochore protein Spc24 n=1 Tax=Holothuria leucospilota TaxID=206669 RepID=A0A9Q1BSS2_HOLLE|nr:Kinetochore protein Spc24 [Holothuria leucospilota]
MSAPIEKALDSIERGDAGKAVASIITMLTNPESVQSIGEYGDTMKAMMALKEQQQSQVQGIIQGLLALLDQEVANVAAEKSSSTQEDKTKEEAEKALSDACQEVEKVQTEFQYPLKNRITSVQREKDAIEEQRAGLLEERERVKEETTHVLPKTRYNISLYTCITGIKWDYECPPEQIKGYVSTSKDVRPFSLSSQQNSKFFITNYLWDLVESACQAK